MNKHQLKSGEERMLKSCADSQIKMNDGEESGGTVTGYASTFDREPDCYGDVVARGAFADTLKRWESLNEQGKFIPLLYGHNAQDPDYNIGRIIKAEEDERGLLVTAEFDKDNERAQYVRKLVKEGRVYQFSFAFDVMEAGEITLENGVKANELRKLEIFEVSIVQIPANRHATVEEIKDSAAQSKGGKTSDGEKAGRRNSRSDEDQLRKALGLLSEATEVLSGLLADSDNGGADGEDEGEGPGESGDKGQKSQAEMLSIYKQVVKATIKEDQK